MNQFVGKNNNLHSFNVTANFRSYYRTLVLSGNLYNGNYLSYGIDSAYTMSHDERESKMSGCLCISAFCFNHKNGNRLYFYTDFYYANVSNIGILCNLLLVCAFLNMDC